MNYLLYIEHSAENLQFYLWYQDFTKRFKQAPASDLALAPEWTKAMEDDVLARVQKDATEVSRQKADDDPSGLFKGTDFEKRRIDTAVTETNPFRTPTVSSDGDRDSLVPPSSPQPSAMTTRRSLANEAFAMAGAKVPCKYTPPPVPVSPSFSPGLTCVLPSHYPTLPGGDQPYHHHVRRRRRAPPAQPLRSRPAGAAACPLLHNTPQRAAHRLPGRRCVAPHPEPPKLHPLDYLQRQPAAHLLRARSRLDRCRRRLHHRPPAHPQPRPPRVARHGGHFLVPRLLGRGS